jgi:hypothetical protein
MYIQIVIVVENIMKIVILFANGVSLVSTAVFTEQMHTFGVIHMSSS